MNLTDITLSKRSQTQKSTQLYGSIYVKFSNEQKYK